MNNGQTCLAAMGALGMGCRSVDELAAHMGISRKRASKAACRLVRRGFVERLERGAYQLTEHGRAALASDEPVKFGQITGMRQRSPSLDSLRQRAWNAIRLTRRFTLAEIITLAAHERDRDPKHNLQRYFRSLTLAGYLAELPTRVPGTALTSNGHKVWRLVRETGEFAPIVQTKPHRIYDRNTNDSLPIHSVGEASHDA